MTFLTKVGHFTKGTGAATLSQAITGVGFQPKVIILWTDSGLTDDTWVTDTSKSFGWSGGTGKNHSHGTFSPFGVTTANMRGRSAAKVLTIIGASSTLAECDLTSFDTDGFTLSWTTNNSIAYIIHYIALGGTDITNTFSKAWTSPTTTGNLGVTGVGFAPDLVLTLGTNTTAALPTTDTTDPEGISLGVMNSTGEQFLNAVVERNSIAPRTRRQQRTDKSAGMIDVDVVAQYVSMDSDGFTMNWTTAASPARNMMSLCIKGGKYKIGSFLKVTGAATASQVVTGVGFQPKALLLGTVSTTQSTAVNTNARQSIGGTDGTANESVASNSKDTGTATDVRGIDLNAVVLRKSDSNNGTNNASAVISSMDSDGFTLSWTTNDAVAADIVYLAFGAAGSALTGAVDCTGNATVTIAGLRGLIAALDSSGAAVVSFSGQRGLIAALSASGLSTSTFNSVVAYVASLSASGASSATFNAVASYVAALIANGNTITTFNGGLTLGASLSLSGDSQVTFIGTPIIIGGFTHSGNSQVTIIGIPIRGGALSLTGNSQVTIIGIPIRGGAFDLSGSSVATFLGGLAHSSGFTLSGNTIVTFIGTPIIISGFTPSGNTIVTFVGVPIKIGAMSSSGNAQTTFIGVPIKISGFSSSGLAAATFLGGYNLSGTLTPSGNSIVLFTGVVSILHFGQFTAIGNAVVSFDGVAWHLIAYDEWSDIQRFKIDIENTHPTVFIADDSNYSSPNVKYERDAKSGLYILQEDNNPSYIELKVEP